MGKYTDNPARILRTINYLTPHAALMQHFEDYFDLWDSFEDLWRRSMAPPMHNTDVLGLLMVEMEHIRGQCKALYNKLRIDPDGVHPIQRLPPVTWIKK